MLARFTVAAALLCATLRLSAEVRLPHTFSDHAVLQRNQPVHVWGWAAPKEHVSLTFHEQKLDATADAWGAWEAWLRPEKAGGPYTLRVTGDQTATPVERTDLLIGDVWVASGQSNMEMPLKGFNPQTPVKDQEKEIAAANRPTMRLLIQHKRTSAAPLYDTEDQWMVCTPDTAKNFSAVAYFFGRKIQDEEKVPIGLIDTSWGGTPAHSWISSEGIAWSGLTSVTFDSGVIARTQGRINTLAEQGDAELAAMKAAGKDQAPRKPIPGDHAGSWAPATLFNAMVAPFTRYTVRGFLWYQGETDAEIHRSVAYSRVFPALIQDWRKQWAQGPLPFFFVQISSYGANPGSGWGNVRDAQRRTLELTATGMAVTLDVGLEKNIHPPDKQTVGGRLAQSALGIAYGKNVETASPLFLQATIEGSAMRAWFSHADGLTSKDAPIGDFEIAGEDAHFVPATARIEIIDGHPTVVATATDVPAPKFIRYGWNNTVKSYLYNAAGLPMSTFTSDSDAVMIWR